MSHDTLHPVTATAPVAAPAATAPQRIDGLSFERLLDSLRKLGEHRQPDAAPAGEADVSRLQDALRAADDGFVTAMDLRQKLEAAFRAQGP